MLWAEESRDVLTNAPEKAMSFLFRTPILVLPAVAVSQFTIGKVWRGRESALEVITGCLVLFNLRAQEVRFRVRIALTYFSRARAILG